MGMETLLSTILSLLIGTALQVLPQLIQVVLDLLSQLQQG